MKAGARVNAAEKSGYTALWCAAQEANLDVMAMLLTAGAAVDQRCTDDGRTPLFCTAFDGSSEALKLLLVWERCGCGKAHTYDMKPQD